MDGESEEEQESAGTADEEEDGDESDLVTPACAGRAPIPGSARRVGGASGPVGGAQSRGRGWRLGWRAAELGELVAVSVQPAQVSERETVATWGLRGP